MCCRFNVAPKAHSSTFRRHLVGMNRGSRVDGLAIVGVSSAFVVVRGSRKCGTFDDRRRSIMGEILCYPLFSSSCCETVVRTPSLVFQMHNRPSCLVSPVLNTCGRRRHTGNGGTSLGNDQAHVARAHRPLPLCRVLHLLWIGFEAIDATLVTDIANNCIGRPSPDPIPHVRLLHLQGRGPVEGSCRQPEDS